MAAVIIIVMKAMYSKIVNKCTNQVIVTVKILYRIYSGDIHYQWCGSNIDKKTLCKAAILE